MKTREKRGGKDVRIVVRVERETANWLKVIAQRDDSSVGRVIRKAISKLRDEPSASLSFNAADCQPIGLAA